jgi:diadenosine tetraphosphate (Ap4A) HIT family hydrolase
MGFELDSRLQRDCISLGRLDLCQLLLMNNAALPWFILVPETAQIEFIDLSTDQQRLLWGEAARVADFVRTNFPVDKLNVGAIGNVVSQLHIHVVGRREDDYCWPDVVWGQPLPAEYRADDIDAIASLASESLLFESTQ